MSIPRPSFMRFPNKPFSRRGLLSLFSGTILSFFIVICASFQNIVYASYDPKPGGWTQEDAGTHTTNNVGLGTTAPTAKLEIIANGTTTGTAFQIDDSLYAPKVTVLDNGNVGIGTTRPRTSLIFLVAMLSLDIMKGVQVFWSAYRQTGIMV